MDNNPARRSSESSDDETMYVLAPEPPEEAIDEWFDAPLYTDILHQKKSGKSDDKNNNMQHDIVIQKKASGKTPLLKLRQENASNDKRVLETNLDTMQQTYIQPEDVQPDNTSWKRTANLNTDVVITFHVLIPSHIDYQADKDKVYVRIWDGLYTETTLTDYEMKFVCYRQEGSQAAQLMGDIVLKKGKHHLNSLSYNYYIIRSGTSLETNSPRISTWEHNSSDSYQKRRTLLCMTLKNSLVFPETFHQYDGYIYEPPAKEGFIKAIAGFFQGNNRKEDAETATKIFGRDIANSLLGGHQTPVNILEATHMSNCLRLCIEKGYSQYLKNKEVRKTLWQLYTDVLQNLLGIEEELFIHRKISVCLVMLNIRHLIGYKSGDPANELLCKSFLMKICKGKRSTIEWEYLQQILLIQDRKSIKENLMSLAKDICSDRLNGKNPSWMFLLPILHFLNKSCLPFQEISEKVDHTALRPTWWGLARGIEELSYQFKTSHGTWSIPLRHVIEKLQYMFEVDFYLPRAMVASLRQEELKDALDFNIFPYEVECASVYFFLKTSREYDGHEKALEKSTETLLAHIMTAGDERFGPSRVLVGLQTSYDLLTISLKRLNSKLVLNAVGIFLSFVAKFDILQSEPSEAMAYLRRYSLNLTEVSVEAIEWLNKFQSRKHPSMYDLLKVWDEFFRPRGLPKCSHMEEWMEIFSKELKRKIDVGLSNSRGGQFERGLFEAYSSGIDTYSQELQDILSSFLMMILAEPLQNENTTAYLKLYDKLSKKFLDEWNKKIHENNTITLETLVSWSALPKLIKVLCYDDKSNDKNKECQNVIYMIRTFVESFVNVLLEGNVCVKQLQFIEKQHDVLFPLCEVLKFDTDQVKLALSRRTEELNVFFKRRATLESLKLFFDDIDKVQVNMGGVDEILQKDIKESTLNELVIVKNLTHDSETETNVLLNVKSLSKDVSEMITRIEELRESGYFTMEWKSVIQGLQKGSSLSLNDVFEQVYMPVIERLKKKAEQITSGEMTYLDMEKFLGSICEMNYDKILFELKTICPDVSLDDLIERIEQFKRCRKIKLVTEVAAAFDRLKNVYGLSGNFNYVERLKDYDIKSLTLSSEKDDVLHISKDLHHVTKEGAACLEAFANCQEIITWIREIIKGGLKELKVFVDLGMTSAGDDIEKISRVQSLHVAVNGFATLIFETKQTSDFEEILKSCECVWEELKNTPKIADKLEYAGRYLHWFKEIKQAHGAVEVTAFMQAENINDCGVYKIGTNVWQISEGKDCQFSLAELSDIKNVLKLILVMESNEDCNTEYTYDKLQDLQSRLMLVAGEAERSQYNVERFNQILEGVVRLCTIYIKLVKSGCMFFQNFTMELVCDTNPNRPVAASLHIENRSSTLKCRKTESEQLQDILHSISTTMESCFTSWLEHIDEHRQIYPELNFFTTEQLVILQHEFCKLHEKKEPSKFIYLMLHNIIKDCKPDDIKEAFSSSSTEMYKDAYGHPANTITNDDEQKDSQKQKFISALIDEDFERMVPFALKEHPDLDIDKAIIWCIQNEERIDEMEAAQPHEMINDDYEESGNLTGNDSQKLKSMVDDMESHFDRCEVMLKKLEELWRLFLESTESNVNNYISLEHVGLLLRHLAQKDQRTLIRSLPRGYSENSPNLVVCKNEDIWSQTLSLYLSDKSQPLPEQDEILTCSEDTTFEQVDIFLRRAFYNSNGKIHTIVNADKMSYTFCEVIEQRLLKYKRDVQSAYRVVFICGSDRENQSVLVSSLDKYRRTVFLMEQSELCICLRDKLQINQSDSDTIQHAGAVDFDRSTVRVVKSSRSGCGKTLFVLRREEELQKFYNTNETLKVSLPLHERKVNLNYVTRNLLQHVAETDKLSVKIIHIDITNEVQFGIDYLLFNLLIVGALVDKSGYVWLKNPTDLYLIETLDKQSSENEKERSILQLLPFVTCRSPNECLEIYQRTSPSDHSYDQLFDSKLYEMDLYQNPYECLQSIGGADTENSKQHCIQTMIRYCGVSNPSWSEIHHFVKFLNTQLQDFYNTDFISEDLKDALPGFPLFVKKFLIQMSRDFSSRSLSLSEESFELCDIENKRNDLNDYEIKRTWESSPHPYLFFNDDRHTFTFLGFYINDFGHLVDVQSNKVLERCIMSNQLMMALLQNCVPIKEDFDVLQRKDKIERLCGVIGVEKCDQHVYDDTYELTTDNCKKMLAVYMRFSRFDWTPGRRGFPVFFPWSFLPQKPTVDFSPPTFFFPNL